MTKTELPSMILVSLDGYYARFGNPDEDKVTIMYPTEVWKEMGRPTIINVTVETVTQ